MRWSFPPNPRGLVHAVPAGVVVDVVVGSEEACGGEGLAVAAREDNPAVAGLVDVASDDAAFGGAIHLHGVTAEVAERASRNDDVGAALDGDGGPPASLEDEAFEGQV